MKILIDGQTLLTPEINRGIGKYFINIVENILSVDFTNDFYLVAPSESKIDVLSPWACEKLHVIEHSQNGRGGQHQEALASSYSDCINDLISKTGIDLYWSLNALMDNVFLPKPQVNGCRYSATIFDLIPLVMEDHFQKIWPQKVFARYRKKLVLLETDYDLFLHISRHTYADFTARLAVSRKSHAVTPLAVGDSFRPYPFPKIATAENYVLYPGGFDPRKNMIGALEAFSELHKHQGNHPAVDGTRLRIVCHADEASERDLRKRARRLGIDDKLDVTGFVTDAELVRLYQKARCLFFPSLYEGFGLPVLEALACGIPVAASNTSSLPEVGGDHALYFNPQDVNEMAALLHAALSEPLDMESRLRRHRYAKGFSWLKTAQITLQAFANTAVSERSLVKSQSDVPPGVSNETSNADFINVKSLLAELSVEELCETAEEFFARIFNWDYLHSKPFAAINETPDLLIGFAHVVKGLNLLPDMTVLDFGAGSCWTSRFLSQMGVEVIAMDVSPSALKIGEELYRRQPVIGNQPPARFLRFDGYRFNLPAESVDRISCWDAFHHVPNQAQVLSEMARVLKPGGIAGFSEPGPEHSKAPQSQYEMRTNRVIENDIDVDEIWKAAEVAGFTDIKVAFFNPDLLLLSPEEFNACVVGTDTNERYLSDTRQQMQQRRLFFLFKGTPCTPADSRKRDGLMAELRVTAESTKPAAGQKLRLNVTAKNTGKNIWLPSTTRVGAVRFGIHLFDDKGILIDLDYYRHDLTPGEGRPILPAETVEMEIEVPMPSPGKYVVQCDLVSEGVCWFEHNGAATVRIGIEVLSE